MRGITMRSDQKIASSLRRLIKVALATAASCALSISTASADTGQTPGWGDHNGMPDIVGDCKGQGAVTPDRCTFVPTYQSVGMWPAGTERASSILSNCTGQRDATLSVARWYSYNYSIAYSKESTVSATLNLNIDSVNLGSIGASTSYGVTTTYGTASTATETVAMPVPAGYKGWFEFTPRVQLVGGWIDIHYPKRVYGHYNYHYPGLHANNVWVIRPLLRGDGLLDGKWTTRIIKC